MKRRINVFLIILAAAVFCIVVYFLRDSGGDVVLIKSDGEIIRKVNLNTVEESESIRIEFNGYNDVLIENGRVCVTGADCPDKLCVKQSERGGYPIVCLPHKLVIEKE